jgi:hypothetical protein
MPHEFVFGIVVERSNYAFKRTAELDLCSKQTIAPQPLNAALGLRGDMMKGDAQIHELIAEAVSRQREWRQKRWLLAGLGVLFLVVGGLNYQYQSVSKEGRPSSLALQGATLLMGLLLIGKTVLDWRGEYFCRKLAALEEPK